MKSLKSGSIDTKVQGNKLNKCLRWTGIGLGTLVIGSAFILNFMGIANLINYHDEPLMNNGKIVGHSLMEGPFVRKTIEFDRYGPGTVEITRQNLIMSSPIEQYIDADNNFDVDLFVSPEISELELFYNEGGFSKMFDKKTYPKVYEDANNAYKQMFTEFVPYIY